MGAGGRILARVGLGAVALTLAVASATPAWAVSGRIDNYTFAPDGHLQVSFSALDLLQGESIDLATIRATVGGQDVPATGQLADATTAPARSTMLTIDVSGSMSQSIGGTSPTTRIAAAKVAADAYLQKVPSDVKVGLVTFADKAALVVPPTTDHATVRAAVAKLAYTPNGATALFDAVILANQKLGSDGLRNQLLLSDGQNENPGGANVAAASASIVASKVSVDAVSIGSDATGKKQLEALTAPKVGNGKTVTAGDTAALTAYFESAAATQAGQVIVDVTVPPSFAGTSQIVEVFAIAAKQQISGRTVAIIPKAGAAPSASGAYGPRDVAAADPGITGQPWFLPVAIGLVGVGLFVLLAIALVSTDRDNMQSGRVRRRLSRYSLAGKSATPPPPTSGALGQSQVARTASEFAGRVVQTRDLDTGLALRLDAAGVPLRPGEWMLIHVGIAVAAGFVCLLLSGFGLLATLLGLFVGVLGPWLYLSIKETRRKARFAEQLPDTLQLLAGSIAAGYSLPQAIDTVVRESEAPMAAELNRALIEARLGVPIEDALETIGVRMDSVDFAWVVMALRIQRDVGGNLAEVLTTVAATMRERERLRRQVDVLSAEGRLSAIILGALPLLFVTYLIFARPEYIGVLVTTPLGILMVVTGVVLMIIGAFWLRKVVKVVV